MKIIPIFLIASLLLLPSLAAERAEDFETLCAERTAIERVYHAHRLGTKPAFEDVMPPALIGQIIRQDQQKAAALSRVYGVEITPAMIAAEAERINITTRAPEVLAEIRHALGDDSARFARAMARPIIVECELRRRFDNDDKLHTAQRSAADRARASLLAKNPVIDMREVTWQLTPRPTGEASKPAPLSTPNSPPTTASSIAYANAATVQIAQTLASPGHAARGVEKHYFADLDPELQNVLRVQLQKPGDVSAVIETPAGFLVFQAREKSRETLTAATFSTPKRGYDEWLAQQKQ
ncbi:MAG: hypothetical protein ABIP20_06310 [Chthoniobacteraceae bacterium]